MTPMRESIGIAMLVGTPMLGGTAVVTAVGTTVGLAVGITVGIAIRPDVKVELRVSAGGRMNLSSAATLFVRSMSLMYICM